MGAPEGFGVLVLSSSFTSWGLSPHDCTKGITMPTGVHVTRLAHHRCFGSRALLSHSPPPGSSPRSAAGASGSSLLPFRFKGKVVIDCSQ